ncbi:hypothetical protein [Geotalea uraniireducens]|uniref:DUF3311 domain-containing protein n=1 Tax=Geotalea uraniireducens (strain Rf4) TaxID=351605 RepID=A5G368_GEOUR|nr:hypothetical protein [Geotalea uraniireducens]ABQ26236.1 hypothetical protein Gura_2046 [Geotalea uraniireducens Rf4]
MWPILKTLLFKRLRLKESWVIFFILGIIMMNYPFVTIFNKPIVVFHIPFLYLYFQIGWLVSIFVIFLFTKAIDMSEREKDEKGERH